MREVAAVSTTGSSATGVAPAQRGPQPGEQLVHAERLGDVVVGAGVERGDLVGLGLADRQHDDRARASSPAGRRMTSMPSMPGRPRSRMHDVGVVVGGQRAAPPRRWPPGRRRSRGPRRLVGQGAADLRLVVDDQDPGHGASRLVTVASRRPASDDRHGRARRPACRRARARRPWRSTNPGRRRARARRRRRRRVAEALERLEHPVALGRRRCPGPWSMTRRSTRSPTAPASTRTGAPGGDEAQRRWRPGWPRPARAGPGRRRPAAASRARRRRPRRPARRRGSPAAAATTSSSADRRRRSGIERAGLEPAHVEQVADERG